MPEHPEKPIATSADDAETPETKTEEHKFGEAVDQKSKEQTAEDEAAEELGNFA